MSLGLLHSRSGSPTSLTSSGGGFAALVTANGRGEWEWKLRMDGTLQEGQVSGSARHALGGYLHDGSGQSRPDGLLIVGGRLKQQHIESCSYKERELFYVTNGPNNKL